METEGHSKIIPLSGERISRRALLEMAGKIGISLPILFPVLTACSTSTNPTSTPGGSPPATSEASVTPTIASEGSQIELTERDRTLVVAYSREVNTLDPAIYWAGEASTVMAGVYENLVWADWHQSDDSVGIVAQLAESWEISPDNKEYTFKLRKGVTFHDGEPYNAEAQKYAFDRALGLNEGPAYMVTDYLEKVEAVDEFTLKLTLKKPVATYMQYISGFWYPSRPISPKAVKDHATIDDPWAKEWLRGNAVGTGPYKLDEWVPNQQYTISRNEAYWRGWAGNHIDRVIHRIIAEVSTQRMLLEKGDIDAIVMPMPVEDFKALQNKPRIVVIKTPSTLLSSIQIHTQKTPTSDVNVRRGLVAAFDYEAAINNVYAGLAFRNGTTYPKGMEGYREDLSLPQKDLNKAKEHFSDAGFSSGLELDLVYGEGDETLRRIAEMFQADLASIGVKLTTRPLSIATMWEIEADPEKAAHLVLGAWAPDNSDSSSLAGILWHSKFPPGGINWSFYKNPKVDELLDTVQSQADVKQRVRMYEDIDQMIRDDAAWIAIGQQIDGCALRDSVKGSLPAPTRMWSLVPYDVYRG